MSSSRREKRATDRQVPKKQVRELRRNRKNLPGFQVLSPMSSGAPANVRVWSNRRQNLLSVASVRVLDVRSFAECLEPSPQTRGDKLSWIFTGNGQSSRSISREPCQRRFRKRNPSNEDLLSHWARSGYFLESIDTASLPASLRNTKNGR